MVTIQTIDEQSVHLDAVIRLWRAHSSTLGFMPAGAFTDYARARHVLVALCQNSCVGYILYRLARDRVSIAHFCVAPEARRQGVARAMLDHLINTTQTHRGILLWCRRDFEASQTWPRLGFHPAGERRGRGSDDGVLVRWVIDYGHADLFDDRTETGALEVAIDANVFVDLVDHRSDESLGLRADWLRPHVELCYTAELLTEINRSEDVQTRSKRKREAQQFKLLDCSPEAFRRAEEGLKALFPRLDTPQKESDFRHLVRAVASGADAFITRDGELLDHADDVFAACGLPVLRPADFIGRIDVVEHERAYQRNFVAGTRHIIQKRVDRADNELIRAIQTGSEAARQLAAKMRGYLANPQHFRCHRIFNSDGDTLAVYVVQMDSGVCRVPMLRICAKRQAGTLARSILTGLVRLTVAEKGKAVLITDATLGDVVAVACEDGGFLPVGEGRLKPVLSGWRTSDEIASALDWDDSKVGELRSALPAAKTDACVASRVEHIIWPAKLADSALPCFIIPIRPHFAEHLFDERLADGGLFGADVDLALNPESAYYRAARPAVVTCPSRVLWYVSASGSYVGSQSIRACSRLVEIAVDTPKRLFARFRRLGVYEWSHVRETAKGDLNRKIMAFRFDDSELLPPLHWQVFQAILRARGVNTNLQSPISVPPAVFGEIYVAAFRSSEVC